MIEQLGTAVYKRAFSGDGTIETELPTWTPLVILIDLIILLPIWAFTQYTLQTLYPTFAIIEDENPPAYEPLHTTNDDGEQGAAGPKPTDGRPQTVTSSLRSISRLLRANGGIFANFRGLSIYVAQIIFTRILMGIFAGILGSFFTPVATLLATLALVQLSTAWVHIAVTPASPQHFWRRLPAFNRTFKAVWKPVALVWFAREVARWLPVLLAYVIGLEIPSMVESSEGPGMADSASPAVLLKGFAVLVFTIVCSVFIVMPAHVILTRVQASLLSPDEDPVIPFDASFEGRIEPAVVGGLGYATIKDAWATFSKTAWRRVVFLYAKVVVVSVLINIVAAAAIIVPSVAIVMSHATTKEKPQ